MVTRQETYLTEADYWVIDQLIFKASNDDLRIIAAIAKLELLDRNISLLMAKPKEMGEDRSNHRSDPPQVAPSPPYFLCTHCFKRVEPSVFCDCPHCGGGIIKHVPFSPSGYYGENTQQ